MASVKIPTAMQRNTGVREPTGHDVTGFLGQGAGGGPLPTVVEGSSVLREGFCVAGFLKWRSEPFRTWSESCVFLKSAVCEVWQEERRPCCEPSLFRGLYCILHGKSHRVPRPEGFCLRSWGPREGRPAGWKALALSPDGPISLRFSMLLSSGCPKQREGMPEATGGRPENPGWKVRPSPFLRLTRRGALRPPA